MDTNDSFDADRRKAMDALTQVVDPEICENIVELTLVLTSPTCPMGDAIIDDAVQALQQAFPDREVRVLETHEVDWSPQRMGAAARKRLGWDDAQG